MSDIQAFQTFSQRDDAFLHVVKDKSGTKHLEAQILGWWKQWLWRIFKGCGWRSNASMTKIAEYLAVNPLPARDAEGASPELLKAGYDKLKKKIQHYQVKHDIGEIGFH